MLSVIRMAMASGGGTQHNFAYGELAVYNPVNHTGQFKLPGEPDPRPDAAQPDTITGFIPVSTFYVSPNGGGAQFPPAIGAQAIVFFLDQSQKYPMCGVLYFNDIETPPFQDGRTQGWLNDKGAFVKTTLDGAESNDNGGGAHIGGAKFTTLSTTGGHTVVMDDAAKTITLTSAGGLTIIMDDNTGTIQVAGSGDTKPGDEVVRQSDLVVLLANIQTALGTWVTLHVSNGSGGTGPTNLTSITPTGSSKLLSG